jgi:hypothetical protein
MCLVYSLYSKKARTLAAVQCNFTFHLVKGVGEIPREVLFFFSEPIIDSMLRHHTTHKFKFMGLSPTILHLINVGYLTSILNNLLHIDSTPPRL